MPPPEAVAGTYAGPNGKKIKVAPLSDEDRLTLVRWIDLGCPIDLDYNLAEDNRIAEKRREIHAAYVQANLIARCMVAKGGAPRLGKLLKALADDSLAVSLRERVLLQKPMDIALRRIYGIDEKQLFEAALEWVKATPVPGT